MTLEAQFAWATSLGGVFDLVSALPGLLALVYGPGASLLGFIWAFKFVRYSPGLAGLGRVIRHARQALLSVLLGFLIVLLTAASIAYLLERDHPDHPEAFASIPAALWWGIVTMTTTGYGDIVTAYHGRENAVRLGHGRRHSRFRAVGRHSRQRLCRGNTPARIVADLGTRRQGTVFS